VTGGRPGALTASSVGTHRGRPAPGPSSGGDVAIVVGYCAYAARITRLGLFVAARLYV